MRPKDLPEPNLKQGDRWSEQSARLLNNSRDIVAALAGSLPHNGVRLPSGVQGWRDKRIIGGPLPGLTVYRVVNDGGTGGDAATPPTYTYKLFGENDDVETATPIATEVAVLMYRSHPGAYWAAPDGSYALAKRMTIADIDPQEKWYILIAFGESEEIVICGLGG